MSRYQGRTLIEQPAVGGWGQPAPTGIGVVAGYGVATGGTSSTITIGGLSYTLLTFTSDNTLTIVAAGLFDVFLVGGGGGGSNGGGNGTGGGGAGQLVEATAYFSTNQTVTVGAGGANNAYTFSVSRCGGLFALGGSGYGAVGVAGRNGGSGSGGEGFGSVIAGGAAQINTVTGHAGGNGSNSAANGYAGGAGGGMGGAGGNASAGVAGTGGAGVSNSFNSVATTYCRGGFGGSYNGTANAAANTGNGGGNSIGTNGAGGSGLVMVRFRI